MTKRNHHIDENDNDNDNDNDHGDKGRATARPAVTAVVVAVFVFVFLLILMTMTRIPILGHVVLESLAIHEGKDTFYEAKQDDISLVASLRSRSRSSRRSGAAQNENEPNNPINTSTSERISDSSSLASLSLPSDEVPVHVVVAKEQPYEPHCQNHHRNGKEPKRTNSNSKSNSNSNSNSNYEAPEPFRYLHDCCDDCNPPVPESPDPLVSIKWKGNSNNASNESKHPKRTKKDFVGTPLQIYRSSQPVALYTIPSDASVVVASDNGDKHDRHPRLLILEDCTVVMDWGSERAAWFEILTDDDLTSTDNRDPTKPTVEASVSEYNRPYPGKTRALTKYGNRTYRLETNQELYEGVRFTFLHVAFPKTTAAGTNTTTTNEPLAIDDFSIVSKIKPMDYTGGFRSSNKLLTKAWYWGAYGTRLNVERNQLNSILIERGDRVAIQGDGHPTIATMLASFLSDETSKLLANVLNATDSSHKRVVDDGIMAYPLYWCLSAIDYYWATYTGHDESDNAFVEQLVADIAVILDRRIDDFLDPHLDITWFGWDDRIGNGWCFHSKHDVCTKEALLAFAGLVIRVCNDFVGVLSSLAAVVATTERHERQTVFGDLAKKYRARSKHMTQALRAVPEYPSGFGVHAAAYAINANVATRDEIQKHWMGTREPHNTLNNAVTICSFSQFNQYWILQALGNIQNENGLEHALKSIDLCWGPMMELSTGGCFWELSSREWLSFMKEGDQAPHLPSYCHPWASGVTPWLSKLLGGIAPATPGYAEFWATPYVSANYPSVHSTVPTPHGPIALGAILTPIATADLEEEAIAFDLEATLEASVSGWFGLRTSVVATQSSVDAIEAPLAMESLAVNGIAVPPEQVIRAEKALALYPGSDDNYLRNSNCVFVRLVNEDDGNGVASHAVTATYRLTNVAHVEPHSSLVDRNDSEEAAIQQQWQGLSTLPTLDTDTTTIATDDVSPFPVPRYPSFVVQPFDTKSQGDGLLVYGKDGYSFLGCNVSDRWPEYVQNVTVRQHGYPGWVVPDESLVGYSDTDPVYLPVPGDTESDEPKKKKRVLGTVGVDDQGGGDINCVLVDVTLGTDAASPKQTYYLSIYFVASRAGNRHAVRVMDGETYDLIAPTTLIKDYQGGLWWTLRTDRSVRLKMMDVEGIHLSAIAFATDLPPIDANALPLE
jgi:hypothetical protein